MKKKKISKAEFELLKMWRDNYYDDPVGFAENVCNVKLTNKQAEMMNDLVQNKKLCVKSCNGSGKTFSISILILWFLTTRWGSSVILSSNTATQTKSTAYGELERVYKASKLAVIDLFSIKDNEFRVNIDGYRNTWKCQLLNMTDEERFQGHHVKEGLLFVIDEASGDSFTEGIFRALMGSDDPGTYMFFSGNPTRADGMFYKICTEYQDMFKVKTITFRDRPDGGEEFERSIIKLFGKDSAEYKVRCLGEFASVSECCVIPAELIREAVKRDMNKNNFGDINIGVDFGRIEDNTVICVVQDNVEIERKVLNNRDQIFVANEIRELVRKYEFETYKFNIKIDSTGIGDAISRILIRDSYLNTVKEKVDIYTINFSFRSMLDRDIYSCIVTEMFFEFSKKIRDEEISLLDDEYTARLITELSSRRYSYDNKNRFKIESKKEYKKRLGKSPDIADALLLSFLDCSGINKIEIGEIERYG